MSRVLIIDDEPQIRRFLRISLGSQGYDVIEASSGAAGLSEASTYPPNLIILDLGLPDCDGKDVLASLRQFYEGPIVVLSVRYEEREKVASIDAGANDYVVKPFGVNELLARIRRLLSTFEGIESLPAEYTDGRLKVDFLTHEVMLDGNLVRLSRKEFRLLRMLIAHKGRIVTQQQLLNEVWGPGHKDDSHYLRVFIGKVRAKLEDKPGEPTFIETEPGVGYRFLGNDPYSGELSS